MTHPSLPEACPPGEGEPFLSRNEARTDTASERTEHHSEDDGRQKWVHIGYYDFFTDHGDNGGS